VKPFVAKRSVPDAVSHMAAAAGGAIVSAVLRVPTDTVRHRVQVFLHPSTFAAVPQLFCAKGMRGFYAGFWPTLMRDVPEIAIQFAAYECLRGALQKRTRSKLATWQHLVLGGLSGALGASMTMPVDVLKTQMQCGGARGAGSRGIVGSLKGLMADKGPSTLFTGMVRAPSVLSLPRPKR
jgi:solute carrier family 25 (mitochondrial S-adenosylmethionine transporter), member 26